MSKKKSYVTAELQNAAKTFQERNETYGDTYKRHGDVAAALFPEGVDLVTAEDQNRYAIVNMLISKLTRYAANFEEGGHQDSLHDITVYAAMLNELDNG
jgi:hypothetical protein